MQRKVTLLSFSQSEMLEEWKMRKGLFSGLRDCTAERDDGVDVDGVLLREIDSWYARLLAEAPIDCLPVEDVASECTVEIGADLRVDVALPSRCVRLVSMKMKSWQEAVSQFEKEGGMLALRQANAWLRGGVCNPVCKVLQSIQSLSSLTDEDSHMLSCHIDAQSSVTVDLRLDLNFHIHGI